MDRPQPIDETLLLAQRTWVRRLARELVSDVHRAEDVVQETWRAALESPPRSRQLPALRRWLRVVLQNIVRREHQGTAARRWHEERAGVERDDPAPDLDARLELEVRLSAALRGLEEPYREAVVLRYVDGLSVGQVARRQSVSDENVRQRLSRGLAKLRARLDQGSDGGCAWRSLWIGWLRVEPQAGTLGTALGVTWMASKTKVVVVGIAVVCGLFWAISSRMTPEPEGGMAVTPSETQGKLASETPPPAEPPAESAADRVPVETAAWGVDRDRDLHGIIVDPTGVPVAGAEVRAHRSQMSDPMGLFQTHDRGVRPVLGETQSDTEGRFAIPLAAGRLHDLEVQASGFANSWSLGHQAGERVVLQLQEGATLEGRVVLESNGSGVAEALVRIGPHGPFEIGPRFDIQTARTGRDGSFRFTGLEPRPLALSVETDVGGVPDGIPVQLIAGRVTTVDVPVLASRSIRGRVTEAATGLPVVGAEVTVRLTGLTDGVCRTANDGTYLLETVPTREMDGSSGGRAPVLRISAPHLILFEQRLRLSPPDTPVETIDAELLRGCGVIGRVLGLDRTPVAGAQVTVLTFARGAGRRFGWGRKLQAVTDARGRFEFDGLRTDLSTSDPRYREVHALHVVAEGLAPIVLELPLTAKSGARHDVGDIELPPQGTLRGEVVDDRGRPVVGADVGTVFEGEGRMRLWKPGAEPSAMVAARLARMRVRTDDLGRFTAVGLPPGKVVVTVRRLTIHRQVQETVVLAAGEERSGLRLVLPGGESIAGRVQTADGEPVVGGMVYIRGEGGGASVETDADGRFRADWLTPGKYTVNAAVKRVYGRQLSHLTAGLNDIATGSKDLTLTVYRAVEASGVVLGPDGEPLARRELAFKSPDLRGSISVYTDEQGRFRARLAEGLAFDLIVKPPTGSGGSEVLAMSEVRGGGEELVVRLR